MNIPCPACGSRSVSILTVYLYFGVGEYNENRFLCSRCARPLKSFFSLPSIFMGGVLLQAGAAALSGLTRPVSITVIVGIAWLVTLLTCPLYPVFLREEERHLARGGQRFALLCLGVLAIALLLRLIR